MELHEDLRVAVREMCRGFPTSYWHGLDASRSYPDEFVKALTTAGYLAALVPTEYGGGGASLAEASVILEEIHRSGGNAAACHAQMYTMATLLRHGTDEQRARYLPPIASGQLRLQSFAVTEPGAGSDTGNIATKAVRQGDEFVISGQKIWTSRVHHSDLMILLARTGRSDEGSAGLSVILVDLREAIGHGLRVVPIRTMINHETNELFFDELRVPAANLIGREGEGFRYILDGMNAERILIAAECIGDGYWFIDRASRYATERVVFGRPIGMNQGVAFPIAQAYAEIRAADLMRFDAAAKFDRHLACGAEANMAKLLAASASWSAANCAFQTYGGFGVAEEYDIERKFRETALYQVAPVSTNLILAFLAHRVLGMPKSY